MRALGFVAVVGLTVSACGVSQSTRSAHRAQVTATVASTTTTTTAICPPAPSAVITTTDGPTFGVDDGITVQGTITNPSSVPIAWEVNVVTSYLSATGQTDVQSDQTYEGQPSYSNSGGALAAPGNATVNWYTLVLDDSYSSTGIQYELDSVSGLAVGWAYVSPSLAHCDQVPQSMDNVYQLGSTAGAAGEWKLWQSVDGEPLPG